MIHVSPHYQNKYSAKVDKTRIFRVLKLKMRLKTHTFFSTNQMEIHELHDPAAAAVDQKPHDDEVRSQLTSTRFSQSSDRNPVAEQLYSAPLDEVTAIEVGRCLVVSL